MIQNMKEGSRVEEALDHKQMKKVVKRAKKGIKKYVKSHK